jgi:aminopeptidase N
VTLVLDRGDTAISNGKIASDTPGPTPTRHTVVFSPSPKMSSYLVAMAVGNFQCLTGGADGIPIRICTTPDKRELGHIALESAERILSFYNTYYAIKYPFGKLDILAVPDFAAGAMENTAAIFYRETDLLADTKSASVATRKTIASVLAHEKAELENQTALSLDALKATRPIHAAVETPAQIDEAFDAIAYEKGAAVLRMIESYVGRDTFRKGVNDYLQAHAYGNATARDFWTAIANASGKPIDTIMPTFVNQPGVPLVSVAATCTNNHLQLTLTQERFVLGQSAAQAAPERWQIPLCVNLPDRKSATCNVVSETKQTITLGGASCPAWVFANAGARGYYRTAYPPEMLRAMAPHLVTDLSAPERLSLMDDEWSLVRAGRHTVADYLTLASGFSGERTSGVLGVVSGRLGFMRDYLTTRETLPKLETFARDMMRPIFEDVGFASAAADPDDRHELRATVIEALGNIGNDPKVIAQSRAALDRSLSGGAPLDPTLASAIVSVAATHGDAPLFDALYAAAEAATAPDAHYRYLNALSDFTDPALVDRGLQLALSPAMRSQDTPNYLAHFLGNTSIHARAWTFIKAHWSALEPKVTIFGGDTSLTSALGSFCDAATRDDIKMFFAAHPLPAAARTLDQTIERINNCIDIREKQTPVLADWFAQRR